MKTTIPAWRILTNWLIAVVTGSILWPVLEAIYKGSHRFEDLAATSFISMVISAIFSIPALAVLFAAHIILNKQNVSLKSHRQIHTVIHLLAGVLTFAIIALLTFDGDERIVSSEPVCIAISYIAAGLTTAFITYRIYEKRELKKTGADHGLQP